MNEKELLGKSTEKLSPKRILIVKLSSLGDIVQSLPVATALHGQFPSAEVTWIVNSQYIELLELVPDIDKIVPFERNRWGNPRNFGRALKEFRDIIKYLQAQRFDLVLDLQGLFRSGLISFLSRIPKRVGFRDAREGAFLFYNHRVRVPKQRRHAVERYLTLAEYIGCGYKDPVFNIEIQEPSRRRKEYIAINPGGRWITKRWPAERFAQLIDRLNEHYEVDIVLIGDENDKATARDIVECLNFPVTDLTGKTSLLQLADVLKGSKLFITNDSGPMHMASALGKPVVALFGPTDPGLTGPWGSQNRIIKSKVSCSPCFKKKCRDIRCMEAITIEQLLKAVEDILQK